jgi:hypothetical protein
VYGVFYCMCCIIKTISFAALMHPTRYMRFRIFMAVKMWVVVMWVLTWCSLVCGY